MPTYQLEHALTGRTYKVRFDSDPTPEDIDHILAQFAEQDGFDPPTLTEMARERTKLTTLQKQAAIFPPLATAADTFMEALPVAGSVKQFISGSTDDPMRAGPSEIRRRLTASQERLANLQRGGRRFLESERASREDTGQGRFSSAFSAIPQEVLKAPGTAVKGFGDVAGAIVPSLQGNVVSQFGEAMNETAREWLPTNPAYQGEIQQKAAQAVGQGAASLAEAYIGGGAARAVGAGEKAITTAATLAPRVTGFLKGASQGEDIAKANQVTDPFARAALVLGTGGIESATEAIGGVGGKEGTQALLGRGIRPRLNAAGEVIASEAGEEMGAGLAQPLLERATITPDPARPGYSLGGQKLAPIPTSIDDAQAWLRSAQEQGFYGAIGAAVPGAIAGMRSQTPDFAGVTEAPVHPATAPTTDAGSTPAAGTPAAGTPSPTPSVPPSPPSSAPRQSLADIAAGAGRSPSPPLPVSASPRLPLSPGTYTGADAHTQITSTLATTAQDPDAPQGLRELDAELSQHDYTGITLEVVDDPNATVEAQGQRLPFTGYASHGTTPGTGTIGVNLARTGRGEASPTDTVRHEALHFRLRREIDQPTTPAAQQALTGLTALRDTLAADPEAAQEFDYETGDLHEWISGIASSKPLRAKLAAMPASPAAQARGIRSMWDQFVAWVKQLVTGKPATQRTALDDALAHVLTLARTTRSTQPSAFRPPPSSTNLLPPGSPSTNLPRDARQPTTPAQTRAADPRAGLRANPQVRSAAVRRTLERIAAAHGAQVRFHQDAALPDAAVKHEKTGITLALSDRYAAALSTLSPEARRGNLTKLQVRLALENGYRAAGQASPKPRTPAAVAKDVMASLVHGYRREEGFAEETRRGFAAALSTLRRKPYAAGDTEVFLKDLNQVIREPKPFLDHLLRQLMELRATGRITEQDDGTFTGEPEWEARTVNQLNRFMVQAAAGTHGDTVQSIIMQSIPALDDSMIATEEGERNLASLPPATAPSPTLPSREDYLRDWIAREKQILRDEIRDIEARYRAERPNPAARAFQRAMSQRFVQGSPENTRFVALRKATRLHAAKLAQARDELRTLTDPAYAAKVAPHRTPEARAQAAADAWAHVRRRSGHSYDWKTHYLFDPITGQILEIPSAGVIADQIGAIAAGVKDLATFTTRLAQRFGDWIKPHARALWNAVKEATRAALMKALEKIGAIKFAVPYQEPSSHARAAGIQFTGQPTPPPFDGAQLVGTCVSEQQINTAFGDMDNFERLVQERGDEFTEGDTTVTYNPRTHEHFFWKPAALGASVPPASVPSTQFLPPDSRSFTPAPERHPFSFAGTFGEPKATTTASAPVDPYAPQVDPSTGRESMSAEDARAAVESFFANPDDPDYWPADIRGRFDEDPLDIAINYDGEYPDSDPDRAPLLPEPLRSDTKHVAWRKMFAEEDVDGNDPRVIAAHEWTETSEAQKIADDNKARYQAEAEARARDTIKQLEARGWKWDEKSKTFGEDERPVLFLPPSVRYPGRGPFKVENLVAQAQLTGSPLPKVFHEMLGRSNEEKAALKNSAARLARDLDAEMRRQVKLTSATRTQLESTVNNALDDPNAMALLAASNPALHACVMPLRNMLDTLSTTVASWTSETTGDTILGNLGSWLRRSYMAFDPSSGWSYDALVDAASKGKAVLGQTPAAVILRNARAFLQAQNPSATPDQITIQMKILTDRQTWLNVLSGNKDAKVTKDVTSLIRRKEIPAPLRALMGEVRDPLARFGQSASFQAQFIARHEMQQRMRDTGLALGIFSPVQTPDHLVQVGGVDGADANPVWSGFGADLWTTPQMLAALRNAKGVNTGTTLRDRILDTIAFIGGKSKEARVALSPDFYSTNIIGAVLALAGSGDLTLSQQSLRSMGKAMQTLWMARLDKTAVTPAAKQATIDAARDLVSRLESAGVLSSGVNMDELLASLTSPTAEALTNTKTKDRVAGAAQGALTLQGLGHTIAGNPGRLAGAAVGAALGGWAGMKNISKPHRALMEALVSTPDLFAKLTAYLNNRDAYLRSGLSAEDAHAKAVEVTRNTMPDYSKVPAFLRELSRLGIIGSFIAFRAESYRNLYWNARYAAQELRSGNPALMLRGAQRLMGIALSQSLAAGKLAGAFGLLGLLSDADDEEDQAYRRSLARKWDANAQLVYDKLDANGASYFSADYLVPQASAMQIIRAAVEGRSFAESMTAVASTIKEQAIGGNLVLQPLIEAYTNSKFEGNFPVSTKQGWEGSFDRALHVLETMEPGYASKAKKLVRAGTGMGLGRAEYTFTDEALRTLGLRMSNVKHEPQIRSKLSEFNARLAATRTSANAAWSNFGGRTLAPAGAKMRQDALDAANAERAQIKADFDDWLKDLSTLRISPQKVKSIGSLPSFAPLRVTKDGVTAAKLR